jgi:signal peptidase I
MSFRNVLLEIFDWSKSLLLVFGLTVLITVFLFEPYAVSGSSMEPTFKGADPLEKGSLLTADRVILYKLPKLMGSEPEYEDIVIIDSRVKRVRSLKDELIDNVLISLFLGKKNESFWIKRVIGKEGDMLEFRDGKVYRNGEKLKEEYIKEAMLMPSSPIEVPHDHIFVMGDNRNNSEDSRMIGPIPIENVRGTILLRFYPFQKMKVY